MPSPSTSTDADGRGPAQPRQVGPVAGHLGDLADRLGTSVPSLLVGSVAALVVGALVWIAVFRADPPPPELTIPYAPSSEATADAREPHHDVAAAADPAAPPAEILVHAAGAVRHPGVYALGAGARVSDLLAAAGGPLPAADLDRVNLAAPLADGSRVYVPEVGEDQAPSVVAGELSPGGATGAGEADPGQSISINTATAAQLEQLPGVGPATAAAIVDHRERQGPFGSVDELIEVRGIGEAKLAALRDRVHT